MIMITMIKKINSDNIKNIKRYKKVKKKVSMCMMILKNNYNNNKQNTYNRRNTYRGRKKNNTYLLYSNYEKTTLSNMQRKHHAHQDQKGHVSLIYGTSTILFVLKILPFRHGLLL